MRVQAPSERLPPLRLQPCMVPVLQPCPKFSNRWLCTVQGYRLMFFGDSITETWAGTDLCSPCERCQGINAAHLLC